MSNSRLDPLSGRPVVVASGRQARPNLPAEGCPFCVGGLEAPDPYAVRAFPNRWPPLDDGRAEVLLYTPDHDASMAVLGVAGVEPVVELWAERTRVLGRRADVGYVLIFENRGPEVGATIAHPHGQLYAFDAVPPEPARELAASACALCADGTGAGHRSPASESPSREVSAAAGWRVTVPAAASWPYELLIFPDDHLPDLPAAVDRGAGRGLAAALAGGLARLDRLFAAPMPYMLWIHQRPTDGNPWPHAHLHVHVAALFRSPGTPRFVAAGELGSGVYFNPVSPEEAADRLRAAGP